MRLTGTFTITARCPWSGALGVGVVSAIPAVGAICPFVSQRGALSTQSFNNYYFGIDGLRLLDEDCEPALVQDWLLRDDPERELRQLLIVDHHGRASAFTGSQCVRERGHLVRPGFAIAGNMLSSEGVLQAMADAFESTGELELTDRLMITLEAGQNSGGDKRGKQSAALKIVGPESAVPVCDLRVDEHPEPVRELRRVLNVAKEQLLPFLRAMPTRRRPGGSLSPELAQYLGMPVRDR